jgi:Heavy metal binding domain
LIPAHQAKVIEVSLRFNYTSVLNIVFLGLAGVMLWRFFTTGGPEMLKHMNRTTGEERTRAVSGKAADEAQTPIKYACSMHPDVIKGHPGSCPKCGMRLIEGKPGTESRPGGRRVQRH